MTTRVAIFVDTQNVYYTAREVDVVVLVSGDGDFDLLAQKIREVHGKRVEVYGVPQLTAASLIKAASEFIPIERDLLLGGMSSERGLSRI